MIDSTAVVGRRVVTRRRGARSLEVGLLFRSRDARRDMDRAWQQFTGTTDRANLDRYLVNFYAAEQKWQAIQRARQCASRLAMRRSRHRLSLLELRHGVDAYSLRDALRVAHELSTDEGPVVEQVLTIAPVEEGRVCSRPPDEITVDEVGANAPPVGVCRNSRNYRRSPL